MNYKLSSIIQLLKSQSEKKNSLSSERIVTEHICDP